MRKFKALQLIVLILMAVSCNEENNIQPTLTLPKVSGYVQKGPFLNGTAITITELSAELVPTGKNYPSQILDNKGSFEVKNVQLSSNYVELKADGFYFNEVSNSNSTTQITLFALSDLTNKASLNVNVLSTLEKGRVEYLLSNGSSFSDAKAKAQLEILSFFEMGKTSMTESEGLDITQLGDDNARLLAISVILQGSLTVPDLSELLANISTDIREDGILNSQTLGTLLINNARSIRLDQIRRNLEARYETLGLTVSIPEFEKYVNQFIAQTHFVYVSNLPELSTGIITDKTANTATCGGDITKEGAMAVIVRGVCWSTSQNPEITDLTDRKTDNGPGGRTYQSYLTSLTPNTTYYLRAYAINGLGISYGNEISFKTPESGAGIVRDIEGNDYHTVTIGTQIWMVENLKTTKYRNGNPIKKITADSEWASSTTGAFCIYNNDTTKNGPYGELYNWYAVNDARGIAPEGWHVASDKEWTTLINYLGGEAVAGDQLKEAGTTYWNNPNAGATNETGFTALPGGYRNIYMSYGYMGTSGNWWTSTESDQDSAFLRKMDNVNHNIQSDRYGKKGGLSVRCVKD
ncbi:MAG TPA: fibrobacter succinogenes major paralogous domain-containing protein [Prolixibacteraceae bacterium]|jgi:uncharacterized protein (TIGR02145 family)